MNILIAIIVGGIAGWLASNIMKASTGIVMNVVLGIVGAVVASALLRLVGIGGDGFVGNFIIAVLGACLLIWGARQIRG
ncbi:MAG: GlsB/YeaQ/YmgE family stress response membrane protein [Rhodobacteraceae bacterium]|nr:GlsB/YeaQ/YmgE family stress response membrane protein [Paracoccaceae bacterium]